MTVYTPQAVNSIVTVMVWLPRVTTAVILPASKRGASVQLAAPGVSILSTTIGNTYQYFSGTSMATPHVSGSAALILSRCTLDTATLKTTILSNLDTVPALSGFVGTGGRLNVDKALRACAPVTAPVAPGAPTGTTAR